MDEQAKALASHGNFEFARGWSKELDLKVDGVEMGDMMEYDVLRVLGRQFVNADVVQVPQEVNVDAR